MFDLTLFNEGSQTFITTKELADVLGVDVDTINASVKRLGFSDVLRKSTGGRPTKVFTEEQATLIKQEIQSHHNLATRQIDSVSTEYEEAQLVLKAVQLLQSKVQALKPKADAYDKYISTESLTTIRDTAKELNIPQNKFVFFLLDHGYITRDRHGNIKPYSRYVNEYNYFQLKERDTGNGFYVAQAYITPTGKLHFAQLSNKIKEEGEIKCLK